MTNQFFEKPILNPPYPYPSQHWELDPLGQPMVAPPRDDGSPDLLHLVAEIKGFRREDAKEKNGAMETYWVPGVNDLGTYGRWAFAEFCDVYEMQADLAASVQEHFNRMIDSVTVGNQGGTA